MILDIHTHCSPHCPPPRPESVISVSPDSELPERYPTQLFSVGIHPWDTSAEPSAALLQRLRHLATIPNVVAVGECGIDLLKGGPMFRQINIFRMQAELAREVGKPLVIHDVKAHDSVIALKRDLRPEQPWAVHGFRNGPPVARMLLREGILISLGLRFNPDTARLLASIPGALLAETDEAPLSPGNVVNALSDAAGQPLRETICANIAAFLGSPPFSLESPEKS